MLTAGGGRLGVIAAAVDLGGWLGWMACMVGTGSGGPTVCAGALPVAGTLFPSWNRGLESPMAALGTTFLRRK